MNDDSLHVLRSRFVDSLREGNRSDALRVTQDAVDAGVPGEVVLGRIIASAMVEVGAGWQSNAWSVSMEHRATTIAHAAVRNVAEASLAMPGRVPEGSLGRAVVACTEGEWHTLPGLMAAESLRMRGFDVTFIGPSVPAHDLATFLSGSVPSAIAISCSMPLSLLGAFRSISALRQLGTHVICGGRGFGIDGKWGLALGADSWAASFEDGARLISAANEVGRPEVRDPALGAEAQAEAESMFRIGELIVIESLIRFPNRWPAASGSEHWVSLIREDFSYTLKAIGAATIVADPSLLTEHLDWCHGALSARGISATYVPAMLGVLLETMPTEWANARVMVSEELRVRRSALL